MSNISRSSDNPTIYGDCRNDLLHSKAAKQNNAITHYNHFLKSYCLQIGIDIVEAKDIPYHGIPEKTSPKAVSEFWGKMIGSFFTYMGTDARNRCNPVGARLAVGSAAQYCSSVKTFFTDKFRDDPVFPVFQAEQWNKLKNNLRGKYREENRALGKTSVTGKASSTREDRELMATGCIWLGTVATAEFWHLSNATYHCSCRGSEVSLMQSSGLKPAEVNEDVYQYPILKLDLIRQKKEGNPIQEVAMYTHRNGVLEDFYFSSIYLVVMCGCSSEYILPEFSKAALKTKDGKSDSKVSGLWTKMFDDILDAFEMLADRINKKLSSHCNKKGSNQDLAENPAVSGIAQIFRSNWEKKATDTLFEYISDSFVLQQQCGKAVSKWPTRPGCGQSPTFDDIDDNRVRLKQFTDILFEEDMEERWHPKVRELLVMTLLLRYDQFLDVLETHPEASPKPFTDATLRDRFSHDHLFVCRVKKALARARVNEVQFSGWVSQTNDAFINRNYQGIPNSKLSLYGGKPILVDPRCLDDRLNDLTQVIHNINWNVQKLQHTVNDIRRNQQSEGILENLLHNNLDKVVKSTQRLEARLIGECGESEESPQDGVIKFSVSLKALTSRTPATEVTVNYFLDDYCKGYELDKKTWSTMDKDERNKLRKNYNRVKFAVRFILKHVDSFPPKSSPMAWKQSLQGVTKAAEERIRREYKFEEGKVITYHTLNDNPPLKQAEKTRPWRDFIPEEVQESLN